MSHIMRSPGVWGQSLMEYTVLLVMITILGATMFPMFKRATQSVIRTGADQIGLQSNAEQVFNKYIGYTITATSKTDSNILRRTTYDSGLIHKTYNDSTTTSMGSETYTGFVRKD